MQTEPGTKSIPIDEIDVGARLRSVDQAAAHELAESIKLHGLLQPIGVRKQGSRYQLMFGAHRLSAAMSLGHTHITANVWSFSVSDDDVKMAEIVENLVRRDLTDPEKDAQTAALMALYVAGGMKPARPHGGARQSAASDDETAADAIAKKTGLTKQTITRRVKNAAAAAGKPDFNVADATAEDLADIAAKAETNAEAVAKARRERAAESRKSDKGFGISNADIGGVMRKTLERLEAQVERLKADAVIPAKVAQDNVELRMLANRLSDKVAKFEKDISAEVTKRVDAYIKEHLDADAQKALNIVKNMYKGGGRYPLSRYELRVLQRAVHPDTCGGDAASEAMALLKAKQHALVEPERPVGPVPHAPRISIPKDAAGLAKMAEEAEARRRQEAAVRKAAQAQDDV